jgi:hypothetical protein
LYDGLEVEGRTRCSPGHKEGGAVFESWAATEKSHPGDSNVLFFTNSEKNGSGGVQGNKKILKTRNLAA